MFVDELLQNQADLGRKKREAAALQKVLEIPGAVDRSIGIKVRQSRRYLPATASIANTSLNQLQ